MNRDFIELESTTYSKLICKCGNNLDVVDNADVPPYDAFMYGYCPECNGRIDFEVQKEIKLNFVNIFPRT